ncbi:MAG: hypothetical protein ACM34K_03565 [Bacillota bacterium]
MDCGHWTIDFGLRTLDFGLWTLDFGLNDIGLRPWRMDFGLWFQFVIFVQCLRWGLWTDGF